MQLRGKLGQDGFLELLSILGLAVWVVVLVQGMQLHPESVARTSVLVPPISEGLSLHKGVESTMHTRPDVQFHSLLKNLINILGFPFFANGH